MAIKCFYCDATFDDYRELALHVSSAKKGHRRGKKWAAKYLLINKLSPNKKHFEHRYTSPDADRDRRNRESVIMELSGVTRLVATFCPACKSNSYQNLPVEYTDSPFAWLSPTGAYQIICPHHQGRRYHVR